MSQLGGVIEVPWSKQPTGLVSIDWDDTITRKLVYVNPLNGPDFNLVNHKGPAAYSASKPQKAIGPYGVGTEFVPASSQYIQLPSANLVSGYPCTVSCWARVDDISTNGSVLYSLACTNAKPILGLYGNYWNANATSAPTNGSVAAATGLFHVVCIHRNGTWDLYLNGVLQGQSGGYNWGEPAAGNLAIGQRLNGSSARYYDGVIQDIYVWDRELSDAECRALYVNHWRFQKTSA